MPETKIEMEQNKTDLKKAPRKKQRRQPINKNNEIFNKFENECMKNKTYNMDEMDQMEEIYKNNVSCFNQFQTDEDKIFVLHMIRRLTKEYPDIDITSIFKKIDNFNKEEVYSKIVENYFKPKIMDLLKKDKQYNDLIAKIEDGTYKIVPNTEGGSTKDKFKIVDKDGKSVFYCKFLDTTKNTADNFGRLPNEQLNLGSITDIVKDSGLSNFSMCNMNVIQNNADNAKKCLNLVITESAKNPVDFSSKYYHKQDDTEEIFSKQELREQAFKGSDNIIFGNPKKSNLHTLLKNNNNNSEFQINLIKGFYENMAVCAIFDLFDSRADGNILINKENGTWQVVDCEIVENLTLEGVNKKEFKFTPPKERECLKDKDIAQNISELTINTHSGFHFAADGFALSMNEIITGEPTTESTGVEFNIPDKIEELKKDIEDLKNGIKQPTEGKTKEKEINELEGTIQQFEELKDYKTYIANIMVNLVETIDKKIEEQIKLLNEKEKNFDVNTIPENGSSADNLDIEKRKLAFLMERRSNAINIFKETQIGQKANEIYCEKHKEKNIELNTTKAYDRHNSFTKKSGKVLEEKDKQFEESMNKVQKRILAKAKENEGKINCR